MASAMLGPSQSLVPLQRSLEKACKLSKDGREGGRVGSHAGVSERWMCIRICVVRAMATSESGARAHGREVRLQRHREEGERRMRGEREGGRMGEKWGEERWRGVEDREERIQMQILPSSLAKKNSSEFKEIWLNHSC